MHCLSTAWSGDPDALGEIYCDLWMDSGMTKCYVALLEDISQRFLCNCQPVSYIVERV